MNETTATTGLDAWTEFVLAWHVAEARECAKRVEGWRRAARIAWHVEQAREAMAARETAAASRLAA